jgi:nucleotide-binding universal stress UspA family protein
VRDILVQLDAGESGVRRLDVAIGLALRLGGRVIGLFAQVETHAPSVVARRASEQFQAAAEKAESEFRNRLATAGLVGKWWRLAHGEPGHVVAETVFCCRYADFVILGQWQPDTSRVPEELVEQVVLHGGRPVFIIPDAVDIVSLGDRPAVAWNGSREASRALHDALPLLERASEVSLLAIRDPASEALARPQDEPAVDIRDHLLAHGIKVTSERLTCEDIGVMDALLARASDLGADLLVMGAHGGLGLSFLRGSGTRYILRHLTLPVLMSN